MSWVLRLGLKMPLDPVSRHLPPPMNWPPLLIVFVASWLSLFGSTLLIWRSLVRLTGDEEYSRWASLLVPYMAYFQFPLAFGHDFLLPYDLPSLFFFSGCLYCVICSRLPIFYLFFAVGTFNRETICMATLFLLIWRWPKNRDRGQIVGLGGHVLAQAAIWIAIKLYLHHKFAGNAVEPGGVYYRISRNLQSLAKPQQWPVVVSVFGFALPFVIAMRKWMKNPAMERELLLLPLWFAIMMAVGLVIEIRVFSELISYMSLAVGLIVYHRFWNRTIS